MLENIFEFWSEARIGRGDHEHPADANVLSRMNHGFDLSGLPGCFMGPLQTAKVVLLFKAPGRWDPADSDEPRASIIRDWQARTRAGNEPLPDNHIWPECWNWWRKLTRDFGDWQDLIDKVAILNIAPYHSPGVIKDGALLRLPSSQVTLDWAHNLLFPAARKKDRVVVCLLAARKWGLKRGYSDGFLFFPPTTPAGYMYKVAMREAAIAAVKGILGIA